MLQTGQRVVVQFGKSKLYSALVRNIHGQPPEKYEAKEIHSILDDEPVVTEDQMKFWEWIADYYMCTPGDVMTAALPGGLKLTSETRLVLREHISVDESTLSDNEFLVLEALEIHRMLTLKEVSEITSRKTVYPIVKRLLDLGIISVYEELKESYKPKKETVVLLSEAFDNEAALQKVFDQLSRAPKQLAVLMKFIEMNRTFGNERQPVKRAQLVKQSNASHATVKQLVEKGILTLEEVRVDRIARASEKDDEDWALSDEQQRALNEIKKHHENLDTVLLHGVTSSGKTEIYVRLIEDYLKQGKQVLYLLPEIALTTQMIQRLRKHFGDRIGVYHSRFNQHERVEIWKRMLTGERYDIVLGARSALFLPFADLGLIIVDESHDTSYKQYDPAPRYNARDSALVLARMAGAKTLLGSATPSIEMRYHAEKGRFGLVELHERYGGVLLPEIVISDLKDAYRKKQMQGHFSQLLIDEMKAALDNNEQIILFQNRRGFSPFIVCQTCGWTPYCTRCDVSLTYHKFLHRLKCHYCGYETHMPKHCEACGSDELVLKGFGTEKIEEDIELLFPEAKTGRLDLDTTRSKNAFQRIINDFEQRDIDILVGTQMITKGLDFENVSLVGIMLADQSLNHQDFRAHERSYQLMSQVAGRAGRKSKRGKVIIQTFQPQHPVIKDVIEHNYNRMFRRELSERQKFHYPPFTRIIRIDLKHRDRDRLLDGAGWLAKKLRETFGNRVLGPEFPPVARVRNKYINRFFIKIERQASTVLSKQLLRDTITDFRNVKEYHPIRVIVDVDPV